MTAGHSRARVMYDTLKRCFDVVGASILLVLLSPLFIAAALAVRLSGPGPILFRQARAGRGGKPFALLKPPPMRASQRPGPPLPAAARPRARAAARRLRRG